MLDLLLFFVFGGERGVLKPRCMNLAIESDAKLGDLDFLRKINH